MTDMEQDGGRSSPPNMELYDRELLHLVDRITKTFDKPKINSNSCEVNKKDDSRNWADRVDDADQPTTSKTPSGSKALPKRARTDDEGFITPSKSVKPMEEDKPPDVATANRYQVFDDPSTSNDPTSTKESIPPILIGMPTNYHDFLFILIADVGFDVAAKVQGDIVQLVPENQDQRSTLCSYLKGKGINFIMTMRPTEKPIKCVVKGLTSDTKIEDLQEALAELNFQPIKINQLTNFLTKTPLPIFQLHLSNNTHNQNIYKVNRLMHTIVNISKYRRPPTTQCFNCQKFGHIAAACISSTRCRKCAGPHKSTECNTDTPDIKTCSNCNGPHPSTFRGCPKFPRVKVVKPQSPTPGRTYADATRSNTATQKENNPAIDNFQLILNALKNIDLTCIFNFLKHLWKILQETNFTQIFSKLA